MLARLLWLPDLRRFDDVGLLVLRIATGVFLIYGVWDNVTDAERMREFVLFLDRFGFAWPGVMAPLSVWAQLVCGALLIAGVFTRLAGWIIAFNFVVAIVMVDRLAPGGFRSVWPALALVVIGAHLGLRGAGAVSLDSRLEPRVRGRPY